MAESTLSKSYTDLLDAVGEYLMFPTSTADWTDDQTAQADRYVQDGYRTFLNPPVMPEELQTNPKSARAHRWSFLSPAATLALGGTLASASDGTVSTVGVFDSDTYLTWLPSLVHVGDIVAITDSTSDVATVGSYLVAAVTEASITLADYSATGNATGVVFTVTANRDYNLSEDYGGIIGEVTNEPGDGRFIRMEMVSEGALRALRASVTASSGTPQKYAIVAKAPTGTTGQRWLLMVWPDVDAAYTLHYRYNALPNKLNSSTNLYPLGGMQFGDAIEACCLWAAERKGNRERGPKYAEAIEALRSAIATDRAMSTPDSLGVSRADGWSGVPSGYSSPWTRATFEGVEYPT